MIGSVPFERGRRYDKMSILLATMEGLERDGSLAYLDTMMHVQVLVQFIGIEAESFDGTIARSVNFWYLVPDFTKI